MKQPKRPVFLMTLAQIMCALAMALTVILLPSAALSALPNLFIMDNLGLLEASPVLHVLYGLQLLAGIVIGVCVLMVLVHIFRICTAVKRHSAFSEITERALGRIVRALLVTSFLLIPLGWPLMGWLTLGLPELFWPVAALLPAFAGFTLTAMVRAVQLLLRRAVSMQEEAELTV